MIDNFVRVTVKVPKDLHDKYVDMANELGVAKSSLMVIDMKNARDGRDIMKTFAKMGEDEN